MSETVHLVDASPYIFRAFHSLPATIRDPAGCPANAVYGFAGFLLRLFDNECPTNLGVCFDGSLTASFRNDLFPDYKAHREPPPAELEAQVPDCREMAGLLGARTFVDDRFEADDLIATLARGVLDQGWEAVVVTSDKDLTQLVSDRLTLLDFARGARLGPADVKAKLGVRPVQVPDYLGLAGDSVDNIPGVRGVGPKSAITLLAHWEGLEEILAEVDRITDLPIRGARALRAKLLAGREDALLSKRLATVVDDVELDGSPRDLGLRPPDWSGFEALCERLGFSTLAARARKQLETLGQVARR